MLFYVSFLFLSSTLEEEKGTEKFRSFLGSVPDLDRTCRIYNPAKFRSGSDDTLQRFPIAFNLSRLLEDVFQGHIEYLFFMSLSSLIFTSDR